MELELCEQMREACKLGRFVKKYTSLDTSNLLIVISSDMVMLLEIEEEGLPTFREVHKLRWLDGDGKELWIWIWAGTSGRAVPATKSS